MNKKYEITNISKKLLDGTVVYRILALKTFDTVCNPVHKDDLGGWIQSEKNLFHDGTAWVGGDAIVRDDAQVRDSAWVSGYAVVSENAICTGRSLILGMARVTGNAVIHEEARVEDSALISENADIGGRAWIVDRAKIRGYAAVRGDVWICEKAQLAEYAFVSGDVYIKGSAFVAGRTRITGLARLKGKAYINGPDDLLAVSPIGSRHDTATIYADSKNRVIVATVGFTGTLTEFEAAVTEKHGDNQHGEEYKALIALARIRFADVLYGTEKTEVET